MLDLILAPVSWIYGAVVSFRNRLYDSGLRRICSFDIPIVCVGNITVGGTGKTPMCEMLIGHFRETHTVALLSRGYEKPKVISKLPPNRPTATLATNPNRSN